MINKEKLKKYFNFKKNPYLMLYKMLNDVNKIIEDKIVEKIEEVIVGMKKEIKDSLKKNVVDLYETVFQRLILNKGDFKGDKGEKGLKGDTVIGKIGKTGLQGPIGPQGFKANDGIDGKDGETPQKGIDYFTKKETSTFIGKILEIVNKPIENIKEEIKKIREDIIFLKTAPLGGGRRTLHRGGMKMFVARSIGTGDGATKTFTLPSSPYDSSQVMAHVGSGSLFPTIDFTISAKNITFDVAPPDGANVAVTMQGT